MNPKVYMQDEAILKTQLHEADSEWVNVSGIEARLIAKHPTVLNGQGRPRAARKTSAQR